MTEWLAQWTAPIFWDVTPLGILHFMVFADLAFGVIVIMNVVLRHYELAEQTRLAMAAEEEWEPEQEPETVTILESPEVTAPPVTVLDPVGVSG